MRKTAEKKKLRIPRYCIVPLLFSFLFNTGIYAGCRVIAGGWPHHQLLFSWEDKIPLVPWTVVIYLGCYVFWVANYLLIGMQGREYCYRFCVGDVLSRVVCALCFLLYPTTITRPEITGSGIFNEFMRFLYAVDAPDNLFPSIHCLVSWFCFVGIRGRRNISLGYRVFSCVMALAVCVSVLTTRQHGIADVFAGIFLAELFFWLGMNTSLYRFHQRLLEPVSKKLFGKEKG